MFFLACDFEGQIKSTPSCFESSFIEVMNICDTFPGETLNLYARSVCNKSSQSFIKTKRNSVLSDTFLDGPDFEATLQVWFLAW